MQVCTSLQTDNHGSTPPLSFYRPDALPATQPTASKHCRHICVEHTERQFVGVYRRTVKARLRGALVELDVAVLTREAGRTHTPVPGRRDGPDRLRLPAVLLGDQARSAVVARSAEAEWGRRRGRRASRRGAPLAETAVVAGRAAAAPRRLLSRRTTRY